MEGWVLDPSSAANALLGASDASLCQTAAMLALEDWPQRLWHLLGDQVSNPRKLSANIHLLLMAQPDPTSTLDVRRAPGVPAKPAPASAPRSPEADAPHLALPRPGHLLQPHIGRLE